MLKMKVFGFGILLVAGLATLITACGDEETPDECTGDQCDSDNPGGDTESDVDSDTMPPLGGFDTDQYANPAAACDPQPENMNLSVEVTEDQSAWVGQCQNRFGLQGVWFTYDDNDDGGKSEITLTPPATPEDMAAGRMCVSGKGGMVELDMYGTFWGAGLGLNLCESGGDNSEISVLGACDLFDERTNIVGFRITIDGAMPEGGGNLRVQFGEKDRAESAYTTVMALGTHDYYFEDAAVHYAIDRGDTDVEPIDPANIEKLQFQVSTVPDVDTTFDFCVSNIIPILG